MGKHIASFPGMELDLGATNRIFFLNTATLQHESSSTWRPMTLRICKVWGFKVLREAMDVVGLLARPQAPDDGNWNPPFAPYPLYLEESTFFVFDPQKEFFVLREAQYFNHMSTKRTSLKLVEKSSLMVLNLIGILRRQFTKRNQYENSGNFKFWDSIPAESWTHWKSWNSFWLKPPFEWLLLLSCSWIEHKLCVAHFKVASKSRPGQFLRSNVKVSVSESAKSSASGSPMIYCVNLYESSKFSFPEAHLVPRVLLYLCVNGSIWYFSLPWRQTFFAPRNFRSMMHVFSCQKCCF